jgi:hypothetical protein
MGTKTVSITATRTYYKVATIYIEVDENLNDEELQKFLTEDEDIDSRLENALADDTLNGGETEYEYSDPTNGDGGHL